MKKILSLAALLAVSAASAGPLRGAIIVAADGNFLGTCEGTSGAYSISNQYSQYGNQYGARSMFNKYGLYGGPYNVYSPYNKYGTSAPYLLAYDAKLYQMFTAPSYRPTPKLVQTLASSGLPRVTVNQYTPDAVDPDVLKGACRNP